MGNSSYITTSSVNEMDQGGNYGHGQSCSKAIFNLVVGKGYLPYNLPLSDEQ